MKKIRVLHVITGLGTGGAEMMLYKLLKEIDNKKYKSFVISLIDGGSIQNKIEQLGVPVYSLKMKRNILSLFSIIKFIELLKSIKPDIIQGWMYHGNLVSLFGNIFYRRPVIWNIRQSLYNINEEKRLTKYVIKLCALFSSRTSYIIFNSKVSSIQHHRLGFDENKSIIIPNGFDTSIFKPSSLYRKSFRNKLGISDSALLIGLVARFHPVKDHYNFLKAAALMIQKYPETYFVMAGQNVDHNNKYLEKIIMDLGISKNVFLLGEYENIPQLTASLDIATLSSKSEAFPNVVGEAMACAVPCVVTDVGDAAWIVGNTGLVVPPQDPVSLCKAWEKIVKRGKAELIQMGKAARNRVIENFDINNVVKAYELLYEKVFVFKEGN